MIVTVLMSRMPEGSTLRHVVEVTQVPGTNGPPLYTKLHSWVGVHFPEWDFDGYIEMEDQDEVQTG